MCKSACSTATEEHGGVLDKPCMPLPPMTMETTWKNTPSAASSLHTKVKVKGKSSRTSGNNFAPDCTNANEG